MKKTALATVAALCLLAQSTPSEAMNCVAYVRSVTGFDLSGNAWQWWNAADGVYARGHRPQPGAVMVFSRTRDMDDGHVAVVRSVRSSREIMIDQANWVRGSRGGLVTRDVSVIDVSENNDWSEVRVEWARTGNYGRLNPVQGFIYPDGDSRDAVVSARYLTTQRHSASHIVQCALEPYRHAHGKHHVIHVEVRHHHKGGHHAVVVPAVAHHHLGLHRKDDVVAVAAHETGHHHKAAIVHAVAHQPEHHHKVHIVATTLHSTPRHHAHVVQAHVAKGHVVLASTHHHHIHGTVETVAER
jgi:surface antigen